MENIFSNWLGLSAPTVILLYLPYSRRYFWEHSLSQIRAKRKLHFIFFLKRGNWESMSLENWSLHRLLRFISFSVNKKTLLTVIILHLLSPFDFASFINPQIPLCSTEESSHSYISSFHVIITSCMSLGAGTVHICSHLLWSHVIASWRYSAH